MSKSRDIADSAATINYIDTVTSNVQDQIDNIDPLPSQTGNAGKYLLTDGSLASWGEVSSSPTLEATASGTLANGDTICMNSDGTVSAITGVSAIEGMGDTLTFRSSSTEYTASAYDPVNNKLVVIYKSLNGVLPYAQVGTITGTNISFGTAVQWGTNNAESFLDLSYDVADARFIFIVGNTASNVKATPATVSGTTLTFGTEVQVRSVATRELCIKYDVNAGKHVLLAVNNSAGYAQFSIVITCSNGVITYGSEQSFGSGYNAFSRQTLTYDETAQCLVAFYLNQPASETGEARTITISGTSVTLGTAVTFAAGTASEISAAYSPSLNKHLVIWRESTNGYFLETKVATVSGTTISFGALSVAQNVQCSNTSVAWDSTANKFVLTCRDTSINDGNIYIGTVTGTDISYSQKFTYSTNATLYPSLVYNTNAGKVSLVYRDDGASGYGKASVWTTGQFSSNMTATNFIGFSDAAYTNGQTATVQIVASQDDAQTGLIAGQAYYVLANGDLSTTPDSVSVYAGVATSATNIIVKG